MRGAPGASRRFLPRRGRINVGAQDMARNAAHRFDGENMLRRDPRPPADGAGLAPDGIGNAIEASGRTECPLECLIGIFI